MSRLQIFKSVCLVNVIEVLELTLDEALTGIEKGQIVDGKTIMLLYHVALKGIL